MIKKKETVFNDALLYAGNGTKGKVDGERTKIAQLAGPIGVAADDHGQGGIFVAASAS